MTKQKSNARYLGDGVYASHKWGMVHLHLGAHDTPPVVALDDRVMPALVRYATEHGVLLPQPEAGS